MQWIDHAEAKFMTIEVMSEGDRVQIPHCARTASRIAVMLLAFIAGHATSGAASAMHPAGKASRASRPIAAFSRFDGAVIRVPEDQPSEACAWRVIEFEPRFTVAPPHSEAPDFSVTQTVPPEPTLRVPRACCRE
jgi:hypothetical protein